MSILIFFLVLFVLILVHEWGHFIAAKKTGMRVDEFGIGFPPKAVGVKRGETEYTFNWLPIGGFVRIWGENGEADGEGLSEAERARAFGARPKWAQAIVLIAGVTMNVIFAWLLFAIINVSMVGELVPIDESLASQEAQLTVTGALVNSPAAIIPTGATITEVSYADVVVTQPTPSQFTESVNLVKGGELSITYQFADEIMTAVITPQQGLVESDPDRYVVGAQISLMEVRFSGITDAIFGSVAMTWHGLTSIVVGLGALISQSVVGEADFSQIAGPVGIVGMVGDAAAYGWTTLLAFTAIISLNLAVINLLPMPALDGGRLVFVAIEALTRRPIPPRWAGRVNFAGFALLMLLMVAVTYNDILRLL